MLLLSTFESNTIVETLCYWLMLGKKMLFAHFVVLLFSHMTFQPSYHIKTEITFMKFKYALIFHEIQTCSHFSFVFRVSSFCNNLVLVYVITKYTCYKMLNLFMLGPFLPPFYFLSNYLVFRKK